MGQRFRRRAFTLVELLVVIGVIVILIGILMPVLVSARRRTQELSCVMNLRALGQAMVEYTRQSRYYPGYARNYQDPGSPSASITVLIWQVRLRQAMGGKSEATERLFHCPARDEDQLDFVRQGETWTAGLADATHIGFGYVVGEPLHKTGSWSIPTPPYRYYSYGLNVWGAGSEGLGQYRGRNGLEGQDFYQEIPVRLIKSPSQMLAVAETQAGKVTPFQAGVEVSRGGPHTEAVGAIHRGGTNVLFCDGHVVWYRLEDITNVDGVDSYEHWSRVSALWNANNRVP